MTEAVIHHAHGLLTYVWHYIVARLLYDDLVRPLMRLGAAPIVAALAGAALATWIYRRRRARPR